MIKSQDIGLDKTIAEFKQDYEWGWRVPIFVLDKNSMHVVSLAKDKEVACTYQNDLEQLLIIVKGLVSIEDEEEIFDYQVCGTHVVRQDVIVTAQEDSIIYHIVFYKNQSDNNESK